MVLWKPSDLESCLFTTRREKTLVEDKMDVWASRKATLSLGLQQGQIRCYLDTLGPKAGVICMEVLCVHENVVCYADWMNPQSYITVWASLVATFCSRNFRDQTPQIPSCVFGASLMEFRTPLHGHIRVYVVHVPGTLVAYSLVAFTLVKESNPTKVGHWGHR